MALIDNVDSKIRGTRPIFYLIYTMLTKSDNFDISNIWEPVNLTISDLLWKES